MTATGNDPYQVFDLLRSELFRYYDTPFGVADAGLQAERRALLDRDRSAWRPPWIEVVPAYESSAATVDKVLAAASGSPDLADFAKSGLIAGFSSLYRHQEAAVKSALAGRNAVLTAGTGSGKTEAFFLPLLSHLLTESRGWQGTSSQGERWWEQTRPKFSSQRESELRPAAVRALILYPMNALVEDQLVRLRRALDGPDARAWLDAHRNGHRFYFGRYTGQTPVSGPEGHRQRLQELVGYLKRADELSERASALDAGGGEARHRYFVPRLDGSETRSRWDMQRHAPDILITNYSMLNVMLKRELERPMFEATREWLAASPTHRFTLVIDELHMYRGTAGTEVAYLLRRLLHRLGLITGGQLSPQVRCLAASASLDEDDRSQQFLEEFFGARADTFDIIPGSVEAPPDGPIPDLSPYAAAIGSTDTADGPSPKELLDQSRAVEAIRIACSRDGSGVARNIDEVAAELFPRLGPDDRRHTMSGLLRARSEEHTSELQSHSFISYAVFCLKKKKQK